MVCFSQICGVLGVVCAGLCEDSAGILSGFCGGSVKILWGFGGDSLGSGNSVEILRGESVGKIVLW